MKIIAKIYKNTKGTMLQKCNAICTYLNVNLEFCSKSYMQNSRGKGVLGYTDGNEIVLLSLKDKYDLFTFFHEVGHCVLHHSNNLNESDYLNNKDMYEKEADNFSELVMILIYGEKVKQITRICKI